jgi:hypothetical protein
MSENIVKPQIPVAPGNPQDYFFGPNVDEQKKQLKQKMWQDIWQRIKYYFSVVWPYIYNFFSFIIYESIKTVKGIVHIAVSQIRQQE